MGVVGYKIYRNGVFITQVTGLTYSSIGLSPATAYGFQVSAVDGGQNESAKSAQVNATTSAAGSGSANLVLNPDFEAGLTNWANWGGTTLIATGTAALSGSQSLIVGTGASGRGQKLTTLSGSNNYVLTFKGRMSAAGDQGWVGVSFRDANGNTIGSYSFSGTVSSTTTQTFQVNMTSPASFAYADVWVWKNAGSAQLEVDDISLVPAAALGF